ncbi:hypothetical protein GH5_04807 [Leishmania sp. Ghana 2012 LV757]|uniref:hypothetical protein n=1 Tax=Leishmania sp. Ghana 2012 LV757 TaxID=2803181 RepID=UPI001B690AEB|nr:hypothetical protein GH5_04807 [Leishmania sp. Ghana 2012 LV757]
MFEAAGRGPYGRGPRKPQRALSILGVAVTLAILFFVGFMLTSRPIISEQTEISSQAYTRALMEIREEWVDPDARPTEHPDAAVVDKDRLLRLYRLRVFVVVKEVEVPKLTGLLDSLRDCNYSQRVFPIDISVHVLGSASAVPLVRWPHGRFDIYPHRLHGNAFPSVLPMMADMWQPQSDFELGMFLTASARVSPHWFQWVFNALRQYASSSTETYFKLATREISETGKARLISPLSETLSGFALGMPIAGTGASTVVTVFATQPSVWSIFTASFWKAVLAHAGPDAEADIEPESWKSFLGIAATKLGDGKHQFLYPPLEKFGALACDATRKCTITELNAAQVAELVNLPASLDQVPRSQA